MPALANSLGYKVLCLTPDSQNMWDTHIILCKCVWMYVCTLQVYRSQGNRKLPWNLSKRCSRATMWVLGTKPGSSASTLSASYRLSHLSSPWPQFTKIVSRSVRVCDDALSGFSLQHKNKYRNTPPKQKNLTLTDSCHLIFFPPQDHPSSHFLFAWKSQNELREVLSKHESGLWVPESLAFSDASHESFWCSR